MFAPIYDQIKSTLSRFLLQLRESAVVFNSSKHRIWSDEVINETMKQIKFCQECGYFSKPDQAARIADQLNELILLIKNEAAEGIKTENGSLDFFENEILIADKHGVCQNGCQACCLHKPSTALIC